MPRSDENLREFLQHDQNDSPNDRIRKNDELIPEFNEPAETIAIQAAEIKRLRSLLEDTFIAIARTGANYDTHNRLRGTWEKLRKELVTNEKK